MGITPRQSRTGGKEKKSFGVPEIFHEKGFIRVQLKIIKFVIVSFQKNKRFKIIILP